MENKNFSILDAFAALGELNEEEKTSLKKYDLKESNSYSITDTEQMKKARDFREDDKKDVTLEVIDMDADVLEHLKDPEEYMGEIILQCAVCKSTKFVKLDSLVKAESNLEGGVDIYNVAEECPHCHSVGKGYILIGQVGKAKEETTQEAAEKEEESSEENSSEENNSKETASFKNDESEPEEPKLDNDESEPEEFDWDRDSDEEPKDEDEESKDEDEESKDEDEESKDEDAKNESLKEDEEETSWDETTSHEDEDEGKKIIKASSLLDDKEDLKSVLKAKFRNKRKAVKESYEENAKVGEIDLAGRKHEIVKEAVSKQSIPTRVGEFIETFLYPSDNSEVTLYTNGKFIDTSVMSFRMNDFLNAFEAQQMDFVKWTTNDDYITLPIAETGTYTIKDIFANFAENKNTFVIDSDDDKFDGNEYDNIQSVIDRFGDYYLDGALSLRSIKFYSSKFAGASMQTESVEESLIYDIIQRNNLKESKLHTPTSVENFIAESIYEKEDLDKVYEQYVKPLGDKGLTKLFKERLGYKDETDLFFESKGMNSEEFEDFIESKKCSKENKECEICPNCNKPINECSCDKEEVNEELWKSARDRKELTTLVNILQESKMSYIVKRSKNENYRYDIYLKKNLNESIEDDYQERKAQADKDIENKGTVKLTEEPNSLVTRNHALSTVDEPEQVEGEWVDGRRHRQSSAVATADTTDFDREVISKIERIANDIRDSIKNNYEVNVPENLIVADIIQDLRLVGGAISPEELADTPASKVIAELYRQFEEEFDGMDTILSILSGEEVHTDRAQRLMSAVNALDQRNFSTQYIEQGISSPQFLGMAVNGMVPYIDSAEITRKNMDKVQALPGYRRRNPAISAYNPHEDERFRELPGGQRQSIEGERREALPRRRNESINTDKFESEVNEYLRNTYEENLVYTNDKAEVVDEGYIIHGTLIGEEKSLPIQWNLKKCKEGYEVTNNLSEEILSLNEEYKLQ